MLDSLQAQLKKENPAPKDLSLNNSSANAHGPRLLAGRAEEAKLGVRLLLFAA